ncbi:MAG: hypothetical protein R3F39_04455 [Myxococcota bacterium]
MRQALELRARVAALAGRPQSLVDDALVAEFDHVLEPLVALAALRIELDTHLAGLDPEAAARDAATLAPQRAARLEAAYRGLVDRRDRLVSESSEIVTGLREIYLDVLDGATGTSGEIQHAAARTRALGESVRLRVDAEREVRELIAAD